MSIVIRQGRYAYQYYRRPFILLAGFLVGFLVSLAGTSNAAYAEVITLEHAIQQSLTSHPSLQVGEHQALAWQGRVQQASLSPSYQLQVETENVLGTGQFSGIDSLETTVSVGSIWEWGNQRQVRINAAEAQGHVLQQQRRIQRLELSAEVARRYVQAQYAQARLHQLQNRQQLLERVLRTVKRRANAGLSPTAERLRAESEVTEAAIQVDMAAQTLRIAMQQLVMLWGGTTAGLQVAGDLAVLTPLADDAVLAERLLNSAHLQQWIAMTNQKDAELLAVRASNQPDIRWSIGSRYHHQSEDIAIVSGVEIPLFGSARNQGALVTAESELAIAALSVQQQQLVLKQQLLSAQSQWRNAADQVRRYQQQLIPQLKRALSQARRLHEEGRYSYLELSETQQALLNAQLTILDAARMAQLAHIEIARLAPASTSAAQTGVTEEN